MTTNLLNNPQHWRERAKDARWLIEQVTGWEWKNRKNSGMVGLYYSLP
jgi:hypothetical protein